MRAKDYEAINLKKKGYVEIDGSPGFFVDKYGSVVDTDCGYARELKRYVDRDGNNIVTIFDENDTPNHVEVAKLVAVYFVDNEAGYEEVLHLDGNKGNNYYGNLIWDEFGDSNVKYISDKPKRQKRKQVNKKIADGWVNKKPIYCHETKTTYESMGKAAVDLGVSIPYISKKMKSDGKVKGMHLSFVGEDKSFSEEVIICEDLETGYTQSFSSIREASTELGIDRRKISNAIKTGDAVNGSIFRIEDFVPFG